MTLTGALKRAGGVLRSLTRRGERGASLVEYALLLALIVTVCLGAMTFFGSSTSTTMSRAGTSLTAAE